MKSEVNMYFIPSYYYCCRLTIAKWQRFHRTVSLYHISVCHSLVGIYLIPLIRLFSSQPLSLCLEGRINRLGWLGGLTINLLRVYSFPCHNYCSILRDCNYIKYQPLCLYTNVINNSIIFTYNFEILNMLNVNLISHEKLIGR